MNRAANRFELTARLLSHSGLRHTPSGLASLKFRVAHRAKQHEAGHPREVTLETEMQAFGPIAESLAELLGQACATRQPGCALHLAGFIDRAGARSEALCLHVTEFVLIEE